MQMNIEKQSGEASEESNGGGLLSRRRALAAGLTVVAGSNLYAAESDSVSAKSTKKGLMKNPINTAEYIPVSKPTPFMSVSPIIIPAPWREVSLELKVTAPLTGKNLPLILLSHGHGASTYLSSLRGYNPLAEFYAAHGFVVIQPTHQSSKALGLDPQGPEGPLFWRSRAQDLRLIIDNLAKIEAAVPGLGGRIDRNRIGGVGHSMGGHSVAMLAGMIVPDPVDGKAWDLTDPRMKAGVLLAPPGNGSELAPYASEHYKVLRNTDFAKMTRQVLVVAGDLDQTDNFSKKVDWRADAYTFSPGPKSLLTMFGAKHALGGVSGYDVRESQDDDPERLGVVQRMSWAYLRSALYPGDASWREACVALAASSKPHGKVESKTT
jgi:hypothetical protein